MGENKVLNNEEQEIKDCEEIIFRKIKQFGRMTYKSIETNVKIFSDKMNIHQETSGFLGKKNITEKEILLNTIQTE